MRLSQIQWTRHNRELERSQLIYSVNGEKHIAYRRVDHRDSVMLSRYLGGDVAVGSEESIDKMLWEYYGYDPTQMTPLERKCWEIEQRKVKGNDDARGSLQGQRTP